MPTMNAEPPRGMACHACSSNLLLHRGGTYPSRPALSGDQCLQRFAEDFGVLLDVRLGGGGRHQSHIVERRKENAAIHGVQVHETLEFEIHGVVGLGAVARAMRRKKILGAATEAGD